MSVDSKVVRGRRDLKFTSLDDVLADAEKLASSPDTEVLGNWPLNHLFMHLASAMNKSIDGISFKPPWQYRLLGFFIKGRILSRGMPPGFRLPKEAEARAYPAAPSVEDALETLRKAVDRVKTERMTVRHPVFGRLNHEEWTRFHLRHAELHLSFAV